MRWPVIILLLTLTGCAGNGCRLTYTTQAEIGRFTHEKGYISRIIRYPIDLIEFRGDEVSFQGLLTARELDARGVALMDEPVPADRHRYISGAIRKGDLLEVQAGADPDNLTHAYLFEENFCGLELTGYRIYR